MVRLVQVKSSHRGEIVKKQIKSTHGKIEVKNQAGIKPAQGGQEVQKGSWVCPDIKRLGGRVKNYCNGATYQKPWGDYENKKIKNIRPDGTFYYEDL